MQGHIRKSTAVMLGVIALLLGALIATTSGTHRIPVFVDTAQAATVNEGPLASFAPVVKRTMPAVVNISSSKVVKEQAQPSGLFDDPFFRQFFGGRMPQRSSRVRARHQPRLGRRGEPGWLHPHQ